MMRFAIFVAALIGLAFTAASPSVAQQSTSSAQPKYDRKAERDPGARPDPSTDEGGIWDISAREEERMARSGLIERDEALNAYIRELTCKLTPEHCNDLRVRIIDQPVWNAFMMPNGAMAIYTGLMLRMDSEAELGCVVGHEAGHFIQNHSLENFRTAKNRANLAMLLSIGAAAAGAPSATGDAISLVTIATLFSYNRQQESEADRIGFDRIARAGYDTRVCAGIWRKLLDEVGKSDVRAVRNRSRGSTGIFDSHPGAAERVKVLDQLALERPGPEGNEGAERYRAMVRPFLADWLRGDLRRRDYGSTLYFIDKRIAAGHDLGVYTYFRGEVFRLRRKEGDAALAREAFEMAATFPDAPAETWRELGYAYQQDKNAAKAREMFALYLQKTPEAEDRALIEADIKKLGTP
jgi:hypothetical protein